MTLEERPATAIIPIAPDLDEVVIRLREEIIKARDYAIDRVLRTAVDAELATNDLSIISRLKKELDGKRAEYTKPLRDHVDRINATFKLISEPLDEADKATRQKVVAFKQEQERIKRLAEEAEAARLESEAKARQVLEATGEIIDTPAPVAIPEVSKQVHADLGTAGVTYITKWEVEDFSKVPDDYKEINAVLVLKVARTGLAIPGIRIWKEPGLRVTTK